MLFLILFGLLNSNRVGTGLDQLSARNFQELKGKSIAVLTNHTALDSKGTHLLQLLLETPGIQLKALLSPEHGFFGKLDQEKIPDSRDALSGLTIFSLYGKHRKPTPEMLKGIDLMLFDIQDIGVRFYTYQTTMLLAMEACLENHVSFMVLDRPNPLGGTHPSGPMLDADAFSFTGSFPMPIVHGMTMGEMAKMFRHEKFPDLPLTIVPCLNWKRSMTYEKTGLFWVNPSPNMRNLHQARLYPAIGLLEYTNISVGRGTDTPFERIGAPWLEPISFAQKINQKSISGVSFVPFSFTPASGPYRGESCGGLQIYLRDSEDFDPIECAYTLYRLLKSEYPQAYQPEKFNKLLGNSASFKALMTQQSIQEIRKRERSELKNFLIQREKYLIYSNP